MQTFRCQSPLDTLGKWKNLLKYKQSYNNTLKTDSAAFLCFIFTKYIYYLKTTQRKAFGEKINSYRGARFYFISLSPCSCRGSTEHPLCSTEDDLHYSDVGIKKSEISLWTGEIPKLLQEINPFPIFTLLCAGGHIH